MRDISSFVTSVRPGFHGCSLYASDAERLGVLLPFLAEGLRRNQKVVCATEVLPTERILRELERVGVSGGNFLESGQFSVVPSESMYAPDGLLSVPRVMERLEEVVADAGAAGWSGVRVASEVSWLSHLPENTEAFHEYEGRVNELLRSHGGAALCQYDRRIFGHDSLLRCLATHCTVFLGGDVFPNPHFTDPTEARDAEPILLCLRQYRDALEQRDAMEDRGARTVTDQLRTETERLRVEEELRSANQAMAAILDTAPLAILVVDGKGRIRMWNLGAEKIFGWTEHEALGRVSPTVPDDELEDYHSMIAKAWEEGPQAGLVRWQKRKGGERLRAQIHAVSLRKTEGAPGQVLLVLQDISEQVPAVEVSESRFRHLAEHVRDAFWIASPNKATVEYISPAYETIWGRDPEDLYSDPSQWFANIHPDDRPRVHDALALQVEGRYVITYRIVRPDGEVRWVLDRAFPVHDEKGEVDLIVGVTTDVTEQVILEEGLQQSQKMEAMGRLAAGMAHDFNNLLASLRGRAEFVWQDLPAGTAVREDMRQILTDLDRGGQLTRQLLDFSRRRSVTVEVVDLWALLKDMGDVLRRLVPSGIAMEFNKEGPGPFLVEGNPTALRQVVLNLVINAADAVQAIGRIALTVGVEGEPESSSKAAGELEGERFVVLTVEDSGEGMTPEVQERVFEPFFNAKEEGKGTGLGLAIVFGAVKQSGGHIRIDSAPGRGTRMRVTLPLVEERADGDLDPSPSEVSLPEAHEGAPARGTVLVVDDSPALRSVLQRMLARGGFEVLTASDGVTALEVLEQHRGEVGVVLTDVHMPRMGGPELLERVRENFSDLGVILMSGSGDHMIGIDLEGTGAAFLQKPFASEELFRLLTRMLPH